jgi:predicted O-methyltransferase YrrM
MKLTKELYWKILAIDIENKDSDKDLWVCKGTPPNDLMFLYQIAKMVKDDGAILEIGTFKGKASAMIATAISDKNVKFYTIDNFKGLDQMAQPSELVKCCKRNFQELGLEEKITVYYGDSKKIGPNWATPLDMIFIDGDHTTLGAGSDIRSFAKWLKPGGFLILHDYMNPFSGVKQAATQEISSNEYDSFADAYYIFSGKKGQSILGRGCILFIKKGDDSYFKEFAKKFQFADKPCGDKCNNCITLDLSNPFDPNYLED